MKGEEGGRERGGRERREGGQEEGTEGRREGRREEGKKGWECREEGRKGSQNRGERPMNPCKILVYSCTQTMLIRTEKVAIAFG